MKFVAPSDVVSWVDYPEDSHFPIQNIPFGAFVDGNHDSPIPCTAIGEYVIDLRKLQASGLIETVDLGSGYGLDPLLAAGTEALSSLRKQLFDLLHEDNPALQENYDLQESAFLLQAEVKMALPSTIGAFVDFYSGIHHASNVGRMFRPDQPPLLPNYRWIPIGYNGRASSVVVSGTPIRRPKGQTKSPNDEVPTFGPTREMDFELEMGFFTAIRTQLGDSIPVAQAEDAIAGLVLVNDWSARDVQRWEYQPLGPFLAKSFGTTISPWIVTLDALEPFRIEGQPQEPAPLPHLAQSGKRHFDIRLEVWLQSAKMTKPQLICKSNMANLYWSIAQQLAHQTSNGTNITPGDLYASGTISGQEEDSFGSMLELTWKGERPLLLEETGETRTFLEDGDVVTLTAFAQGEGFRIGFGEATGLIEPATP